MEIKTENFINIVKLLSWVKIIQLALILIIIFTSITIWENRIVVYNSIKVSAKVEADGPLILDLSDDSKKYLDSIVTKSDIVIGIQIISVDFKKNSRSTSHFAIDNDDLQKSFDTFIKNKIAPTPLFSSNEQQNQSVIELINGEFVCRDVKDTIGATLFKDLDKSTKLICSISVPPYYGRFSGYLNLYIPKTITAAELVTIKQISRDISLRIYEVDIDKSNKYKVN